MIKAILFDMDDLLVHSSPLHFEAFELAFKDFGVKNLELPTKMIQSVYGMKISEIIEIFAEFYKININSDEILEKRDKYFMKLVKKGIEPMPGFETIIRNVKSWEVKRALATSGIREYADEVLKQLNITDFFHAIATGDEVKNSKPSPEIFLLAAKKLNERPENCVVLEDSTNGITAAKKANMFAIAIKNSRTDSGQDLKEADIILNSLDELTRDMLN